MDIEGSIIVTHGDKAIGILDTHCMRCLNSALLDFDFPTVYLVGRAKDVFAAALSSALESNAPMQLIGVTTAIQGRRAGSYSMDDELTVAVAAERIWTKVQL